MLLQLIFVLALAALAHGQDNEYDTNYPAYPDNTASTNAPATPQAGTDYGEYPENKPEPQYPDYTYVEPVVTPAVTSTTTTITRSRRPTVRRQTFPRTPTGRQSTGRQANRIVRWYILNELGIPIRTAVARSYRTNSQPYGFTSIYGNRALGSRSLRTNGARGQQLQRQRLAYMWYL